MRRYIWPVFLALALTACAEGAPAPTAAPSGGGVLAGLAFNIHQEPG